MTTGIAVFDFDWSLIEEDSDDWTIGLSLKVAQEVEDKTGTMQWTDLMDYALCRLQENGITIDDIANNLKKIPFSIEMQKVLLYLKERNVPVILLSDANTFYIETILNAYGVRDCVTEIITNPSYVDEKDRLRIQRHILSSSIQHDCKNPCSKNLCKGKELDAIIKRYNDQGHDLKKIAYTGDGKNDFCPATRLRKTDAFFIRKEKSLDDYLTNSPQEKEKIHAQFIYWLKPETVWETMQAYFC